MPAHLGHAIVRWKPRLCSLAGRVRYDSFHTANRLQVEHRLTLSRPPRTRNVVFSGIQPTGVPHLGNYLGALRAWKSYQDRWEARLPPYKCFWCVVDLHAMTVQQDAQRFYQQRIESFASLLAIGLDKSTSTVFMQSDVDLHTRLMWILSTMASTGYLSRMTQWKSKLDLAENANMDDQKVREKLKLGLFSYPVLQAADVLLYNPDVVPVGEDQVQHIEFTRTLAKSFNSQYRLRPDKSCFKVPELDVSPAKRIMSLRDPTKKMSKSDPNAGSRILITDTGEEIHRKMRAAVTDSTQGITYDPDNRPGVSNLIDILAYTMPVSNSNKNNHPTPQEVAKDNANVSMKALKEAVADSVIRELDGVRDRFQDYMRPAKKDVQERLVAGAEQARRRAKRVMRRVNACTGLSAPQEFNDDDDDDAATARSTSSPAEQAATQRINEQTIKALQRQT